MPCDPQSLILLARGTPAGPGFINRSVLRVPWGHYSNNLTNSGNAVLVRQNPSLLTAIRNATISSTAKLIAHYLALRMAINFCYNGFHNRCVLTAIQNATFFGTVKLIAHYLALRMAINSQPSLG